MSRLRKKRFSLIVGQKEESPDETPDERAVKAFGVLAEQLEGNEGLSPEQIAAVALRFAVLKCAGAGLDAGAIRAAFDIVLTDLIR